MGNLYNLVNEIGKEAARRHQKNRTAAVYVPQMVRRIEKWKEGEREALQTIPRLAAKEIGGGKTILTLSSSALVKETILRLKPKKVRALVLESRPLREGEKMAHALASAGVPTILAVDSAFGGFSEEMDVVLIGADRISNNLINKVGSRLLLEWASSKKLPVICAVQTSKIISFSWCVLPLPSAPAKEVSKLKHPKLEVRNFYFEEIPLELVKTFVTEKGKFYGKTVGRLSAAVRTSHWFGSLLKKLS